jgi:hypothetical protein
MQVSVAREHVLWAHTLQMKSEHRCENADVWLALADYKYNEGVSA